MSTAPEARPADAAVTEALQAALDWIDAVPADVVASLPAMPGFDRDWANAALLSDHPAPEPGAKAVEARNAALEEAAKVAEAEPAYPSARAKEMVVRVDDYLSRGYSDGQIGVAILQSGSITTSRAIAAAIRALKTPTGFAPRDSCTYPGGCQHNTSCAEE